MNLNRRLLALTTVTSLLAMTVGAAAAASEDWRYLMHTERYGAAVDAVSIRREGGRGQARLLTAPKGPDPSGRPQALVVTQIEIDCPSSRKRVLGRQAFTTDGQPLQGMPGADDWAPVLPDTPAAALKAVVCDDKPLDTRSAAHVVAFYRLVQTL